MIKKIINVIYCFCALGVLLLAYMFYARSERIQVEIPLFTTTMAEEYQALQKATADKRQSEQAARERANIQMRMITCESDEECIIVDKDPCGCLKGPEGVTAINSLYSLEFSRLVEKSFAQTVACPSQPSLEKECSASARAVCQEKRCHIAY